jgi:O-antigen/teichoic acid export membrane protein
MLGHQLKRLARHSVIYGLGGIVSRILAILLLPLYTHYLSRSAYGQVELVTASTAVAAIVLQMGISSAFFRFYFDTKDPAGRLLVVRTSFWFTMGMATLGLLIGLLFADQISHIIQLGDNPGLVRAGAVGLWAQTNYGQITSLFRVEERSVAYSVATISNVLITVVAMVTFVAALGLGAIGLIVGNFTGTLVVYFALLAYRREQLGLQFSRPLLRKMQHFGLPLVPSALALWGIGWIDRIFVAHYNGQAEVGLYSVAIKIASIVAFIMLAFRTAWPAFAYSIEDDGEARRTYSFVLTYLLFCCAWVSLGLGALAPWITALLTAPKFQAAQEGVALLAFAGTAYAGYTVLAIGSGRARRTQLNWVVTGTGVAVNIALNFWLIPEYGMVGAAISTLVAYVVLFVGMFLYAQHVYPVPYQWRRVLTLTGLAVGLTLAARVPGLPFVPSLLLAAIYPVALAAFGFYLPAERKRFRRLVPISR